MRSASAEAAKQGTVKSTICERSETATKISEGTLPFIAFCFSRSKKSTAPACTPRLLSSSKSSAERTAEYGCSFLNSSKSVTIPSGEKRLTAESYTECTEARRGLCAMLK
ncbi:MAG: hypothetical protein BWY11_02198 [Firmicutes bacterium ADurb.Bin182]|nr:MAG: hypothetical protein BWY11_02198 [Firmicutes bacterium ADurb.Bin182]